MQFIAKAGASTNWMLFYGIATAVCYILDALSFIIVYKHFSVPGDEHTEILMMNAVLIFLAIDVYFVIWADGLKRKLPHNMSDAVSSAILGQTKKLRRELINNVNKVRRGEIKQAESKLNEKLEKDAEQKQASKSGVRKGEREQKPTGGDGAAKFLSGLNKK